MELSIQQTDCSIWFHHIFRRFIVGKSLQNFYIFLQYFIGYTELVLSVHKGLPQDMVTTPLRNALNKTIRTKNQLAIDVILMNGCPFQLFHPAFSGQNSLIPKFIQLCIHPFGIILKEHLFQFFQNLPEIYQENISNKCLCMGLNTVVSIIISFIKLCEYRIYNDNIKNVSH